VELQASRRRHASIRFLFAPAAGRLAAARGMDDARAADGVVDVALYRAVGDALAIQGDFRDRIGHVVACADAPETARAAAERARSAIGIDVERADEGMDADAGALAGAGREAA
jgi:biotin carboxylase